MYQCLVVLSEPSKALEAERTYVDFKFSVSDYRDLFNRIEKTIKLKPFMMLRYVSVTFIEE